MVRQRRIPGRFEILVRAVPPEQIRLSEDVPAALRRIVREILVEDRGFGRSRENWTVHFDGDAGSGDLVRVRVDTATLVSLRGAQVETVDSVPRTQSSLKRRLTVVSA